MAKAATVTKLFALEYVAGGPDFCKADAAVLAVLIEYTNWTNGAAWPSVETIAYVGQLGRRTVQGSLRRLEAAGLVATERGGGRTKSSRYRVRLDRFERSPFQRRIKEITEEKAQRRAPFEETAQRSAPFPETAHSDARKGAGSCAKGRSAVRPNPSYEPILKNPSATAAPTDADGPLPAIDWSDSDHTPKHLREIDQWLTENQHRVLSEVEADILHGYIAPLASVAIDHGNENIRQQANRLADSIGYLLERP